MEKRLEKDLRQTKKRKEEQNEKRSTLFTIVEEKQSELQAKKKLWLEESEKVQEMEEELAEIRSLNRRTVQKEEVVHEKDKTKEQQLIKDVDSRRSLLLEQGQSLREIQDDVRRMLEDKIAADKLSQKLVTKKLRLEWKLDSLRRQRRETAH